MSLDKIIESLDRDTKSDVNAIISRARKEAEEIMEEGKRKAKRVKEETVAQGREISEKEKEHRLISATLEARNRLLEEKRKIIDEVYRNAIKTLKELPDNQYRDIVKRIILRCVSTGEEEILISESERSRIDKGLIEGVNKDLEKKGIKGRLTISKDSLNMPDGFVIRSDKSEVINTWDNIINYVKDETLEEVAKILFDGK